MKPHGSRLRQWAARVCSAHTMEHVIDPLIADMQHESEEAVREKHSWRRLAVLAAGYLAFWQIVLTRAPGWAARQILRYAAADNRAVGRVAAYAIVATGLLTSFLTAVPVYRLLVRDRQSLLNDSVEQIVWAVLLIVPQALALTVPLAVLVAVLCGLRGRDVTARVRNGIVILGVAASVVVLGTVLWLIPLSDRLYRATLLRRVPQQSIHLSTDTLRERALRLREAGQHARAGQLLLAYHQRLALAGAALGFAIFALSVSRRRPRAVMTLGCASAACSLYVLLTFYWASVYSPVLGDERIAIAVAWLPSVLLVLTSAAVAPWASDARSG